MTGKSTTEVLVRASGGASGTHGHLHDIYKGSVYYFHHKKHADYIQYTPTKVKKKSALCFYCKFTVQKILPLKYII